MIKEGFGETVRELRLAAELTQEELALESDVALRFLQDIEAGNLQPTITTVFKIAGALSIKPSDLLDQSFANWLKEGKPNGG